RESASKPQGESPRQIRPAYLPPDTTAGTPALGTSRSEGVPQSISEHSGMRSTSAGGQTAGTLGPSKPTKFRNRKLFMALGLLLGFTGAHNFYAGYWGTALLQIL